MKKSCLLILFSFLFLLQAGAQGFVAKRIPPPHVYIYEPGYINMTEAGYGFGLGDVSADYSKSVFSLTTVNGYLISNKFVTGVGTGISVYNGGTMIPLFIDLRYNFLHRRWEPFVGGSGGLLMNFDDFINNTGLFIHPTVGVRRVVSHQLALLFTAGPMVQMGTPEGRSTFIRFNAGVLFTKKYVLRSPKS